MTETTKEVLEILTDFLRVPFEEQGYTLKKNRFFENTGQNGRVRRYSINLSKNKGWFSLHLKLHLLDPALMRSVNTILDKVLRDERFEYPENWSHSIIEKTIKTRTSNHTVAELTDWRGLRNHGESLEHFNDRFSIWLYSFDHLDEMPGWKEQLMESLELAMLWFSEVDSEDWIRSNTDYPSLYLLNKEGLNQRLTDHYKATLQSSEAPQEVKLFYEYLP